VTLCYNYERAKLVSDWFVNGCTVVEGCWLLAAPAAIPEKDSV
jgi:hypothetical protein